ncbi:MAG: type II CAAX endopeptidase family protein [Myxococcota bacterium]|nr:type II CAAX endopeptidase family protein [Myxococcota bacterium]
MDWISVAAFYGISLTLAGACALLWGRAGKEGAEATLMLLVMMFTPTVAALAVNHFRDKAPLKKALGLDIQFNLWLLAALVLPVVWVLGTALAATLVPGVELDLSGTAFLDQMAAQLPEEDRAEMMAEVEKLGGLLLPMAVFQGVLGGATINAFFAAGEEMGWRGFLHRHLRPLGFWPSSLLVGAMWGLWHAPVVLQGYNFPDNPTLGVGVMALWGMVTSPLFTWIRERTGSILGAAVMHGVFNGLATISLLVLPGVEDLVSSPVGLVAAGVAALTLPLAVFLRVKDTPEPAPPQNLTE